MFFSSLGLVFLVSSFPLVLGTRDHSSTAQRCAAPEELRFQRQQTANASGGGGHVGEYRVLTIFATYVEYPEGLDFPNAPWGINAFGQTVYPSDQEARNSLVYGNPDHTSINDWFIENSYGRFHIAGEAVGPYTINMRVTPWPNCDNAPGLPWCWDLDRAREMAVAAASADGVDVASYDRIILVLPYFPVAWPGTVTLTDDTLYTMFVEGLGLPLAIHEFGHSLGLWHAERWDCYTTIWRPEGLNCDRYTWGDKLDCMGSAIVPGHFSANKKLWLGWLDPEQIISPTESGIYTLTPLETSGGAKAIRVPIRVGDTPYEGRDLWMEFRQPIGFEGIAAAKAQQEGYFPADGLEGLRIYRGPNPNDYPNSELIDMQDNGDNNYWLDAMDVSLRVGESFTEPVAGVKITVLSITGAGENRTIQVQIELSPLEVVFPIDDLDLHNGEQWLLTPIITGGIPPYSCSWLPYQGVIPQADGCQALVDADQFFPGVPGIGTPISVIVQDSNPNSLPSGSWIRVRLPDNDCNSNGYNDVVELLEGFAVDCNHNAILDECEWSAAIDCDSNHIPDHIDICNGTLRDCDQNSYPDECEFPWLPQDCNANGSPDCWDVEDGVSQDCNGDRIPDECPSSSAPDCNHNSRPDSCDIADGLLLDCNHDGVPDSCQVQGDCDQDGIPDYMELCDGQSYDCNNNWIPDDCEDFIEQVAMGWSYAVGGGMDDFVLAITADHDGNIYLAGQFRGTVNFNPNFEQEDIHSTESTLLWANAYVTKLDRDGHYLWTKSLGLGSINVGITGIKVSADENLLLTGFFRNTVDFDPDPLLEENHTAVGANDIFLSKWTLQGTHLWTRAFGGVDPDFPNALAIDPAGPILISGRSGFLSFLMKRDSEGQLLWNRNFDSDIKINQLAIDPEGNSFIVGSFLETVDFDPGSGSFTRTSNGSEDIFVTKLNSEGVFLWNRRLGATGFDRGNGITIDNEGDVLITGRFYGVVDFAFGSAIDNQGSPGSVHAFLTKLDAIEGANIWTRSFLRESGLPVPEGSSLAVDQFNRILLMGKFATGSMDFNPDPSQTDIRRSRGSWDCFVTALNRDGSYLGTQTFGGSVNDEGLALISTHDGGIVFGGAFRGQVDFNLDCEVEDLHSSNEGSADLFAVKFFLTRPVLFPIENQNVEEGHLLGFSVMANDPSNLPLFLSATQENGNSLAALGAVFTNHAGQNIQQFVWRPNHSQIGEHQIRFTASNGSLETSQVVTITVLPELTQPLLRPAAHFRR